MAEYRAMRRRRTERKRNWKNSTATERLISHFSAGECTERGRPVKALHFAPTATRRKECGLDYPPSPLLCCFQLSKKCEKQMGTEEMI